MNRTFCEWVGYAEDELLGTVRLQALLSIGARIFHQTHWAPLLRMQGSLSEVKLDVTHRNGTKLPMVLNAIRRVENGVNVHEVAAFVARDRDNYERELLASRRRLEELVAETTRLHAEAKERAHSAEQMIAIVSHDLRNPLSTITLGAGVIRRETLTAQQERSVALIERSSRRASVLIGDLLDFAQARLGGGLRVARRPIDLHDVVHHALDELRGLAGDRELVHEVHGVGACSADPDRIDQLVGNLVSNALSYGEHGTTVTVSTTTTADACTLSVHNRGTPIPAAAMPSLFLPMTRGEEGHTASRSIGLGLFIVDQIALAHEGTIEVESTAAGGTTFTVTLPGSL